MSYLLGAAAQDKEELVGARDALQRSVAEGDALRSAADAKDKEAASMGNQLQRARDLLSAVKKDFERAAAAADQQAAAAAFGQSAPPLRIW